MACYRAGSRGRGIGVFDYVGSAVRSNSDFVCHVSRWTCAQDFSPCQSTHSDAQCQHLDCGDHCIIVSLIAGFIPADVLWDLTSMGTLIAFTVVSIGVILLRYRMPNALRGFKVPLFPVLPILSILACLYLIASLAIIVYVIAGMWVVIAGCYYFFVASKNSALEKHSGSRV